MLFEEFDQVLSRDSTVLGTGYPVSLQAARIEPLADRARGHFTDLRDLSSCEDLHRRLSITLTLTRLGPARLVKVETKLLGPLFAIVAVVSVLLAGCGIPANC